MAELFGERGPHDWLRGGTLCVFFKAKTQDANNLSKMSSDLLKCMKKIKEFNVARPVEELSICNTSNDEYSVPWGFMIVQHVMNLGLHRARG